MSIPFNKPYMTGRELYYIAEAHFHGKLAGDGPYTGKCHEWLEETTGAQKALLTHSCTAALEMSALLLGVQPGDEIIMPSYTFVSTANAFAMRGGVPVFVDLHEDTLNLDETLIEAAITPKTKAIVVVHYAGVACEMDVIMALADKYDLKVIEDAAQGVMSKYKGKPLGSIGHLGAFSFHETKNLISGEGGALLVNDASLISEAEIIREKGTDRSQFFRGEVDKYTWQSIGSSFLPGELIAAFLWAQLEESDSITHQRLDAWHYYHAKFEAMERQGKLRRPIVPETCQHNAHMYYVILPKHIDRQSVLESLKEQGIGAVFHYVPLHSSPAGLKYCRSNVPLPVTEDFAERIVRLPLWLGLSRSQQDYVIDSLASLL